ncbi:hypothetical protein D3C73_1360880 [compost metagenome]
MWLAKPAEQDTQHGVGVGGGAHGRARVGAHAFLVHDDGRRQSFEHVHIWPGQGRHEALDKSTVGLVDHALRLCSDGGEDQRTLPGTGNTREDRQSALRDLNTDVLQVVFACALNPDQIVGIGRVPCRRLLVGTRSNSHHFSIC